MSTETRPGTPDAAPGRRVSTRTLLVVGVLVSLLLAGIVSFYSSSRPDGLEYVAEQTGFGDSATSHAAEDSPFADYTTRGIRDERLSGGLAGVVGASLVFVVAGGLFIALRRRGPSGDEPDDAPDAG